MMIQPWVFIPRFRSTLGLSIVCLTLACSRGAGDGTATVTDKSAAALRQGENLARNYCGGCHLFPPPDLLDKNTWSGKVLPAMGHRFGIYEDVPRDSLIERGMAGRLVNQAGIFPLTRTIEERDWARICAFYASVAPDSLMARDEYELKDTLTVFTLETPAFSLDHPAVTTIHWDGKSGLVYMADASRNEYSSINILSRDFRPVTSLGLPNPVSQITIRHDTLYALVMGHLIPSDEPNGVLIKALKSSDRKSYEGYVLVLKNLRRPVDMVFDDIDKDGDEDIIVCEFGNHTGCVSLFLRDSRGHYRKRVLSDVPGAVKVAVADLNNDSMDDIIVLMAQGDEGVDVFYNSRNGEFEKKRLLRFPAVYGSVSFVLKDMNLDGYPDLVVVNGDNGDFSTIPKPYHGIRIFINDGRNSFDESFFFRQHGAYRAIAEDFDMDGDVDIASVSFFPDFMDNPLEGFVYLENTSEGGTFSFRASTLPGLTSGRWIVSEVADVDDDGDLDLLLGSFTSMSTGILGRGSGSDERFQKGPAIVLLRNNTR